MYSLIVNIGNMWHFQTQNTIEREKEKKNYDELEYSIIKIGVEGFSRMEGSQWFTYAWKVLGESCMTFQF